MALIIEANNQKQNHQTTPASQINTKYRTKKNKKKTKTLNQISS